MLASHSQWNTLQKATSRRQDSLPQQQDSLSKEFFYKQIWSEVDYKAFNTYLWEKPVAKL